MRKFFAFVRGPRKARRLFGVLLSLTLLLGCFGMGTQAAATDPTRVVCTYAGEDGKTMGFHWYTGAACASTVLVDGAPYTGASVKFQGSYAHRAVVEGLASGPHVYDIGGVTGTFHVNPGTGNNFEFIVTGDVQASDKAGFDYSAAVHAQAWAEIPGAAFSVILGDHTNSSNNAQWDGFFASFAPVLAKGALVPIAGNHDGNFKWNWFRNMFTLKEPNNLFSNPTGVYYSFDYGDAHIAVLNTNDMYPMSAAQQNWLVNDMKRSAANWKIVLMHRAPYSAGNDANLPDNLIMRRTLLPLFDKAGVDLVMYGHDHQYVRTRPMRGDKPVGEIAAAYTDPAGAVYILPGAAATKLYDMHSNMLPAVRDAMAVHKQTGMPMFAGISIAGNTLTYMAYTYDPATGLSANYDHVVITKTRFAGADPNFKPLPTDFLSTLPQQMLCFLRVLFGALFGDYLFRLLPGMFGG